MMLIYTVGWILIYNVIQLYYKQLLTVCPGPFITCTSEFISPRFGNSLSLPGPTHYLPICLIIPTDQELGAGFRRLITIS